MAERTPAEAQEVIDRADKLLRSPERLKRWGIAYICVAATAVLILTLVLLVNGNTTINAVRATQLSNTGISKNTNLTAHQVKQIFTQFEDCIQPTGKCYQAGQRRTGNALVALERSQLAQLTCAAERGLPAAPLARQHAISQCAAHLLNSEGSSQ